MQTQTFTDETSCMVAVLNGTNCRFVDQKFSHYTFILSYGQFVVSGPKFMIFDIESKH